MLSGVAVLNGPSLPGHNTSRGEEGSSPHGAEVTLGPRSSSLVAVVEPAFAELQAKLRSFWPTVTLRSIGDIERTVVVVHSISFKVPDHLIPVFPAYEERFLCLVLSLLQAPRSRVVYVTSQPIHPRVLDYYFGLVPELDTPEARSRFFAVSLVDGRNEPLARKLLARPGAIRRVRGLIGNPELAFILPFCMTPDEMQLAVELGLPIYGADPALNWLGTKRGSRRVFAEEGVPHPAGLEVDGERDLSGALRELRTRSPGARGAVLKLDQGVSGLGNALIDLSASNGDVRAAIELEDPELTVEDYLGALNDEGGIVEERIHGELFRSPSVQLRMSPAGRVDIMSTHDQVLGGPHGQTYFGCHFPADQDYAERIAAEGLKVGRRLAREGVIGRASVDFVAVGEGGEWRPLALEINLRCGGTTHPLFALTALTDGAYEPLSGEYRTRLGDLKHYAATDHLDSPAYESLTPDDLLDVVAERGLGWDAESETGVVLHMLSALAVAGRIGLTAIGDDLEQARGLYYEVKGALDEAAGATAGPYAHFMGRQGQP
jgi:PGM1 C-terminal domain